MMRLRLRAFWVLSYAVLCLALLSGAPVLAQEVDCAALRTQMEAAPARAQLTELLRQGCLGEAPDKDPSTVRVQQLFATATRLAPEGQGAVQIKDVALGPDERRLLTLAVLRVAADYVERLQASAQPADKPRVERLQALLGQASRETAAGVPFDATNTVQGVVFWQWDNGQLGNTDVDVAGMLQEGGCNSVPRGPACPPRLATAEGLVRAAHFAARAYSVEQASAITKAEARAVVRDAQWRSYFADTRSQYPWELLVNNWAYERSLPEPRALRGPPTSQWILLHPDVAMQYVGGAAAGDRFKPALVLDLVGYNFWKWGDDNKPKNALGASLVRTYADTASVPSGAWGISVHVASKYTITLTDHDGKAGVLLSIDLAGAVTKASQEWQDRFRLGK